MPLARRRMPATEIRTIAAIALVLAIPILSASGAAGQVPTPEPSPSEPPTPAPPSPEALPSPQPGSSTAGVTRQSGTKTNSSEKGTGAPSRPKGKPDRQPQRHHIDACTQLTGVAAHGPGGSTTELETILARSDQPMRAGFLDAAGPFPVAGPTWWTNDWHVRRCEPYPHLHEGLDMFARVGTPVVAAADGRVSQSTSHAIAGLSVEITDADGVQYFYAHLSRIAEAVSVGDSVEVGDVLGFVGDTGNARGGSPHLHLEIQPGGVPVPPKPYVDRWLSIAERRAQLMVRTAAASASSPRVPRDAPTGFHTFPTPPGAWPAPNLNPGWHRSIRPISVAVLSAVIPLGVGLAWRTSRRRQLAWRQLARAVRISAGRGEPAVG